MKDNTTSTATITYYNSTIDLESIASCSKDDLYMYSHEGQPLIRKLAPQPGRQQQQILSCKQSSAVVSSLLRMVIAGFLAVFTVFLILSPQSPLLSWSSSNNNNNNTNNNNNNNNNNNIRKNDHYRPFQSSLQPRMSSSPASPTATQMDLDFGQYTDPSSSSSSSSSTLRGCRPTPIIVPAKVTTRTDLAGFASYWNYAGRPMNVTYDERSLIINGQRTLFLSGSMHPARATRDTWNLACDEAVRNGLNMITIYIFWSAHQPLADQPLDWSLPGNTLDCQNQNTLMMTMNNDVIHENRNGKLAGGGEEDHDGGSYPSSTVSSSSSTDDDCYSSSSSSSSSCRWDLATAIRAAASRGLWVHIRLGPYDCAEYNYGGIPAWLPLQKPHMAMRRYDPDWLQAMQDFVTSAVQYLRHEQLWAYQGGPIVLAQIENELGGDEEEEEDQEEMFDSSKKNGTSMQDYANWCGDLATRLEPNVTWTMCNGLSAPQTITTCNGVMGGHSCSTTWLETFGESGRIQKDQPAFWTEAEQGFQIWGESPQHPSDYFWGTNSKDMAYEALRWFARGGASLNWYMWWGGYNRGRAAAAGISNMYASDAPLCPSGQRRHPKFGHLQALHESIADVAALLVDGPSALFSSKPIEYMNAQGRWEVGSDQRVFVYRQQQQQPLSQQQPKNKREILDNEFWREAHFVENDSSSSTVVRFPVQSLGIVKVLAMEPQSSALVVDGILRFDSAAVNPRSMSYTRIVERNSVMMLDWQQWMEPRTAELQKKSSQHRSTRSNRPTEQTNLTVSTQVDSDYVWYETNLTLQDDHNDATLWIDTQKANAFAVFLNGELAGTADNHQHAEGNITLSFRLGNLTAGEYRVAILSESLGYFNLIGRWGADTHAKTKGITGDVALSGVSNTGEKKWRYSLLDGRDWLSFAGLHGERPGQWMSVGRADLDAVLERGGTLGAPCSWSSALFDTPNYDLVSQGLFVEITIGRGHLWLNGRDLGRFWNITREYETNEPKKYSQQYYLLPYDFLYTDGKLNELVFFNGLDGILRSNAALVMSWTQESDKPNFLDQVDFPQACI